MNRAEAIAYGRAVRAAKLPPMPDRFWQKIAIAGPDDCWLWQGAVRNSKPGRDYGAFWLDGRHQPAHRVALELSGVTTPAGMQVCHRCDTPRCCNPSHLFVGTNQDNVDDKVRKDRHAAGGRNGVSKLTAQDVARIRAMKADGRLQLPRGAPAQIAEDLGISKAYVSELFKRGWGLKR